MHNKFLKGLMTDLPKNCLICMPTTSRQFSQLQKSSQLKQFSKLQRVHTQPTAN